MMNFLKACTAFVSVCMFSPAFADVSEYEHVIHPGNDDGTGFWNVNADWFMYAPAFGFKRVEGAAAYLFKVTDRYGHEHRFDATRPTESLAGVWRELPTGDVHVRCEGVGSGGEFVGLAGERMFWKAEGFRERTYPPAKRGYRAAAKGVYDYVFSKKGTRILLETGKVDLSDPIASYASKYCAGLIRAMVSYAEIEPARREEALRVATRAADYLIGLSETEGAPLAWFPPTYAGPGENDTGVRNAGKIMLVYPASVASAFVSLSKTTGDRRFLDQAERIAATYLRLQGEDGTWYLKMNAADGTPDGSNRLMPIASTIPMFETLFKATGKELYRKAADRAFSRFDATRMADWNWEGQFEDVPPSEAYRNLTKHDACSAAIYFGDRFPGDRRRQAQMRELLRFAEDQFVCWVPPHDGCAFKSRTDWQASRTYDSWQTPCVLEQYECYWPIDSSAAKLIRTYLALYRAEGNPVDLAKAKALGDTMTRVQREDGSIPTWWYNPRCTGNDWVNCMIASATALAELAEVCEQDKKEDLTGANPAKCLKNKGL